jgi:hypothetical protein
MKYILILIFFIVSTQAQNTAPTESTLKQKTKTFDDDELDKEFYTYYYLNLPKHLQKEDKDKKKLQANILKVVKKEIEKRDRSVSKEELLEISVQNTKIKRVHEDSPWMKLLKKEIKYIQFTDFMYISKYKKYLILVIYSLDPEKHRLSPSQVEYLKAEVTEPIEEN